LYRFSSCGIDDAPGTAILVSSGLSQQQQQQQQQQRQQEEEEDE